MLRDPARERPSGSKTSLAPHAARSSILNLVGQGVPLLAAVFAAPRLIAGLGTERFGLLTVAWMLIGYFSLFDMGLGRALTQIVAEKVGHALDQKAPPVVWPAMSAMLLLGVVGGGVLASMASWLVYSVLKISPALQHEAVRSVYLLALGTPLVVTTAGIAGVLTAYHRFGSLNAIRVPLGMFTFLSPLVVLPFSDSLVYVVAVLVVGRLLTFVAYFVACRDVLPPWRESFRHPDASIAPLFRFGVWMTLSNVLAPLIQQVDRFFIGASVSVTAVAYYATPYEVVTKLLIVPGAITAALFPLFAANRRDSERLLGFTLGGVKWVGLLLFPALLLVSAFAHEGLQLWLGPEFADHGAAVVRWLAVGVFVNAIAQVFMTVVHGVGRPDVCAKFHVVEVIIYLPLLWLALGRFGIAGAAAIWTVRVALDCVLLYLATNRYTLPSRAAQLRLLATVAGSICGFALPALVGSAAVRGAVVTAILCAAAVLAWRFVLSPEERSALRARLGWTAR